MADIAFRPTFTHQDWIDNVDVVQAGEPNGFNKRFGAVQDDFREVGRVVGELTDEIEKIQRLTFKAAQSNVTIAGNGSVEFPVETYDRLPENVEKVYAAALFPTGPAKVFPSFIYDDAQAGKVAVKVQFHNLSAAPVTFNFKILSLTSK